MALDIAEERFARPRRSIGESLASVDWDFPKRATHSEIEGVHPCPAKFIAEIPRALLEILPVPPILRFYHNRKPLPNRMCVNACLAKKQAVRILKIL